MGKPLSMYYALSVIVVLIFTTIAFYRQISERKHRLQQACLQLENCIQNQVLTVKRLFCTANNVHSLHALYALLRKQQAIQTLGLYAIDQRSDAYDQLHIQVQHLLRMDKKTQKAQYQQEILAFKDGHLRLKKARRTYNKNALQYNDCQRNAVQGWFAHRWGHQMAPPC